MWGESQFSVYLLGGYLGLLTVLVGAPQPLRRCALLPRFAALDLYLSIRRARLRRLTPRGRGRPFPRPLLISWIPVPETRRMRVWFDLPLFLRLRSRGVSYRAVRRVFSY